MVENTDSLDDMNELDSIDSTLKAGTMKKGKSSKRNNQPDITGISSGKKDKDEEAMMKDFGDVSVSEHDAGTAADITESSGDTDSLENLDAELGDAPNPKSSEDSSDEEEHHSRPIVAKK